MYVGVGRFRGRVGRDKSGPYGDGVWGAMTVITEIRAPTYSMLEGMYYPPSSGHYGQRASLLRLGLCTITAYGMSLKGMIIFFVTVLQTRTKERARHVSGRRRSFRERWL